MKQAKKIVKKYWNSGFEIKSVTALINGIKHKFTDEIINIGEGRYILK